MSELTKWHRQGGVLIINYDMFRILICSDKSNINANMQKTLRTCLIDPGPDFVVCDEGHLLKNNSTGLSKAVNQLKNKRRIVLTGTPLQNNLKECE